MSEDVEHNTNRARSGVLLGTDLALRVDRVAALDKRSRSNWVRMVVEQALEERERHLVPIQPQLRAVGGGK